MSARAAGKYAAAAAAGRNTAADTAPEGIPVVAAAIESAFATDAEGLSHHDYRGLHYPGLCRYYGLHAPRFALPDRSES